MSSGKPQDQSLAIAYSIKRKAKKMSKGGEVNESLHPEHSNPNALKTQDIDSEHQSAMKQEHDQPMATPAEPKQRVDPMEEDMGRNDPDDDRIMRAVRMAVGGMTPEGYAKGGSVDEHQPKEPGAGERLAMNDTYPPGAAESDTQAQDEGFGEGPMNNQSGDADQEEARRRTRASRALTMARMNG